MYEYVRVCEYLRMDLMREWKDLNRLFVLDVFVTAEQKAGVDTNRCDGNMKGEIVFYVLYLLAEED